MSVESDGRDTQISRQVTEIVAAYVANNDILSPDVAMLIGSVGEALRELYAATDAEAKRGLPTQAEIRKSITPDFLISFIDGKPYRTLPRHLKYHGFDGVSYRSRYGLPIDYPMVAPSYSARRSEISQSLGTKKRDQL